MIRAILTSGSMRSLRHKPDRSCATKPGHISCHRQIFPEEVDIPIGIAARLWQETGGLDEFDTEDLLNELFGLSLLVSLDLSVRTLRLHDVVRHFLQTEAGQEGLIAQHKELLGALGEVEGHEIADPVERRYYYQHLPYHLALAGDRTGL